MLAQTGEVVCGKRRFKMEYIKCNEIRELVNLGVVLRQYLLQRLQKVKESQ